MRLRFNTIEIQLILFTLVLNAFVLAFRRWGLSGFEVQEAIINFAYFFSLLFCLYIIFLVAQKITALKLGYTPIYEIWSLGPMIAVLITFMTYGLLPLLYLGHMQLERIKRRRIGLLEQSVHFRGKFLVALMGPLTLFLINLLIITPLYVATQSQLIYDILFASSLIILFTSIPLPRSNGINLIMAYPKTWLVIFLFGLISTILLLFGTLINLLLVLILSAIAAFVVVKFVFKKD